MRKLAVVAVTVLGLSGCSLYGDDTYGPSEPAMYDNGSYNGSYQESGGGSRGGVPDKTGPSQSAHRPSRAASTRLQAGTEENGVTYQAPPPKAAKSGAKAPVYAPLSSGMEMIPN